MQGALSTIDLHGKLTDPPTERWLRDELNHLMDAGLVRAEGAINKRKWLLTRGSQLRKNFGRTSEVFGHGLAK